MEFIKGLFSLFFIGVLLVVFIGLYVLDSRGFAAWLIARKLKSKDVDDIKRDLEKRR